jgi:hypothetical protein
MISCHQRCLARVPHFSLASQKRLDKARVIIYTCTYMFNSKYN